MWDKYRYYEVFANKFTISDCSKIIELHRNGNATVSELFDSAGKKLRDSHLFWIHHTEETDWLFERIESIVLQYNSKYNFEIIAQSDSAQLTRYTAGQHYGWHMDLGSIKMSLRKITVVVELSSEADHSGGGIEIFYGDETTNKVQLHAGDVIVFPSFVMHRAAKVNHGVRWSLVSWINGCASFR